MLTVEQCNHYGVPVEWFKRSNPKTFTIKDGKAEKSTEKSDKEAEAELDEGYSGAPNAGQALADVIQKDLREIKGDEDGLLYIPNPEKDKYDLVDFVERDRALYEEYRNSVSSNILGLSMCLQQGLRAMAKTRKQPYQEFGNLDMSRITAITKGLDKRVFYQSQPGMHLNTAVEIVLDESGSMNSCMHETVLLLIAVSEALTQINVPFEVFGSTTDGSEGCFKGNPLNGFSRTNPLIYHIYKTYAEKWKSVCPRIVKARGMNNNIDGEWVEFACKRVSTRKEARKVVFVLSDGIPMAGHGNDEDVMMPHLKQVVKQYRKKGIEIYAFGLGTDAPERFYGKEFFLYLPSMREMGIDFFKRFTKIITEGRFKV